MVIPCGCLLALVQGQPLALCVMAASVWEQVSKLTVERHLCRLSRTATGERALERELICMLQPPAGG